jgi:putative transposase
MKRFTTITTAMPTSPVGKAWEEVSASFDRFCLAAGLETLGAMMERDAEETCGPRHSRGQERRGHRWGRTQGKIGFHGGKVAIDRPRVRERGGKELSLASWDQAVAENWLGKWAMNLMLINVSTRRFGRAVRLPEGDIPAPSGSGVSKSAASRRFVALSAERMKEWMFSDLSKLDLLVIQIDGIHMTGDLVLVAAIGIDGEGVKHPLGLIEGATENAAVVQALIDNLVARGLDPAVPRLFIIDGSKALSKAIRQSFGRDALIQRCQIHKARNIMERLPKPLHAAVRRGTAPSLGVGRRRQGREADPQSRPAAGTRCAGRVSEHSGGPRRNPHRHAAWPAGAGRSPAPTSWRTLWALCVASAAT